MNKKKDRAGWGKFKQVSPVEKGQKSLKFLERRCRPCGQMSVMTRHSFLALTAVGLMLLCSCATHPLEPGDLAASALPSEVGIKILEKSPHFDAPYVKVTLHLENGTEFKCVVDTGSPETVLPKSVEQQLGKRLGRGRLRTLDGPVEKEEFYATPKIYLGDTPLKLGDRIGVWTNSEGVLGMDCLRHYCVQLDFQTGKMRFLKSGDADANQLGKAFSLTSLRYAYIRQNNFFDQKDSLLLIDTGDPLDGMMNPKLLRQAVEERKAQPVPIGVVGDYKGKLPKFALFPTCSWNGETYTNLIIESGHPDIIGLRFLARHQVTFDFPKKVMYLKYWGEKVYPEAVISQNKEEATSSKDRSERPSADVAHRP
jgi:hypothetical protein